MDLRKVGRRVTKTTLIFCLTVSTLGGFGYMSIALKPKAAVTKTVEVDYTRAQALAEQVARVFLTYDGTPEDRQKAMSVFYPDQNLALDDSTAVVQTVDHVAAMKPLVADKNRIRVPVDVWLTSLGSDNKPISRHLDVVVSLYVDPNGSPAVDGLPTLMPASTAKAVPGSTDTLVSDQEVKEITPVLNVFLQAYYGGKDPIDLKSVVADGVSISPLGGFEKFSSIKQSVITTSVSGQYKADCDVVVVDPVLNVKITNRVLIDLKKNDGRYFVTRVE